MNVLSTLMPNSAKVKEILKDQSLELDGIKNKYLFGENFKEKLSKITTAKQKSKTIFTGLQKSLSSISKIYHKSYSYQITPKGGNTAPKIFSQIHPSIKTLMTLGNLENLPAACRLRFFLENWKKLTNDSFILKVAQGYQIPLLSETTQFSSPSEVQIKQEEQILVDQDIEKMLEKQAIKLVQPSKDRFLRTFFIFTKKDAGYR